MAAGRGGACVRCLAFVMHMSRGPLLLASLLSIHISLWYISNLPSSLLTHPPSSPFSTPEFKVLDEELAPLAAALEEDELVYIEAAELARLADDIIDLRTSMGLGDTQVERAEHRVPGCCF